jgi:wyosine [tRNA(Phe)-imidazoG37] synthetase (radical SAM superfamily)
MIDRKALYDYIDNGTIPEGPRTVHIDIIDDCNLNCITCWNHSPLIPKKTGRNRKPLRLSFRDYKAIISDLRTTGLKKLILSGSGEPFLHEDCYRMIDAAKKAAFHVTVLTNATLVDPLRLMESPPDKLLVNLGAARARTYRNMHPGCPVDFDRLLSTLKKISRHISITLVMVVSKINYRELIPFTQSACSFGKVSLSFKKATSVKETAHLVIGEKEAVCIKESLEEIEEICDSSKIPHNLEIFKNRLDGVAMARVFPDMGCYAGLFYSRIYMDGNVFFCCAHIPVGNLFDTPFSQIWRGSTYNRLRKKLSERRYFPECAHCGKFNLNYRASMLIRERAS